MEGMKERKTDREVGVDGQCTCFVRVSLYISGTLHDYYPTGYQCMYFSSDS